MVMALISKSDSDLVKQSIAYKSKPNSKIAKVEYLKSSRIIMTLHRSVLSGVMAIKVWEVRVDDWRDNWFDQRGIYWGRTGDSRWTNFWLPTTEEKLKGLIENYDTDVAARDIRSAFEFIAQVREDRKKEIEEIVRLELE